MGLAFSGGVNPAQEATMRIRDDQHRTIDLRTLSDAELRALAYEGRLSRAALVTVVSEMRRRARKRGQPLIRRERHDTPPGPRRR
jgi:hypothetical protein